MEIKLKSNAIFDSKRKYKFPTISIKFLRPSSYIEIFDQIDFSFGTTIDVATKVKANAIRKLVTFFYQLHKIDKDLCKREEKPLSVCYVFCDL